MKRQVVIQSFSPIVCTIVAAEAPELRNEFLGSDDKDHPLAWETYVRFGRLIGVDGFNPDQGSVTAERIAAFHQMGKTVSIWTVDKPEDVKRLASWGADGIITDMPDMALHMLGRKPR
jgi:glycerophosphoryl diester phosphodiesterase